MADDENIDARRKRLEATLKAHEAETKAAEEAADRQNSAHGLASAFRMSTEFVSAVVVGGVIGYGLDWWLGTLPWLMIAFVLLGFAAGVLNVLRAAGLIQPPQAGKRPHSGGA